MCITTSAIIKFGTNICVSKEKFSMSLRIILCKFYWTVQYIKLVSIRLHLYTTCYWHYYKDELSWRLTFLALLAVDNANH